MQCANEGLRWECGQRQDCEAECQADVACPASCEQTDEPVCAKGGAYGGHQVYGNTCRAKVGAGQPCMRGAAAFWGRGLVIIHGSTAVGRARSGCTVC